MAPKVYATEFGYAPAAALRLVDVPGNRMQGQVYVIAASKKRASEILDLLGAPTPVKQFREASGTTLDALHRMNMIVGSPEAVIVLPPNPTGGAQIARWSATHPFWTMVGRLDLDDGRPSVSLAELQGLHLANHAMVREYFEARGIAVRP